MVKNDIYEVDIADDFDSIHNSRDCDLGNDFCKGNLSADLISISNFVDCALFIFYLATGLTRAYSYWFRHP